MGCTNSTPLGAAAEQEQLSADTARAIQQSEEEEAQVPALGADFSEFLIAFSATRQIDMVKKASHHGYAKWEAMLDAAQTLHPSGDDPIKAELEEQAKQLAQAKDACSKAVGSKRYTEYHAVETALFGGDVVLLRGAWMSQQARARTVLPRRQEVPVEAFWDPKDVMPQLRLSWGNPARVNLVAISYCWFTKDHPDPEGKQLQTIARAIDLRVHNDASQYAVSEVALFFDWCSLYQNTRTEQETQAFIRALGNVNLWYATQCSLVWMLTKFPAGTTGVLTYEERGWPGFERAVSTMISDFDSMLDLGMLDDTCTTWRATKNRCIHGCRPAPMTPERFSEELKSKVFTNDADIAFVAAKYAQTFEEVMGGAVCQRFANLSWTDDQMPVFVESLLTCQHMVMLQLENNRLGDEGVTILAKVLPKFQKLKHLLLHNNHIGPDGAEAIAQVLGQCPSLTTLKLAGNNIPSESVSSLRNSWEAAKKIAKNLEC